MTRERTYEPGATFFQNRACEYFPCHEGVDEHAFNCLFCYCPLYALGPRCGGDFSYTSKGVKVCKRCTLLHVGDSGADVVKKRFKLLAELARLPEDAEDERAEARVPDANAAPCFGSESAQDA